VPIGQAISAVFGDDPIIRFDDDSEQAAVEAAETSLTAPLLHTCMQLKPSAPRRPMGVANE
jgi:hypothetical protein